MAKKDFFPPPPSQRKTVPTIVTQNTTAKDEVMVARRTEAVAESVLVQQTVAYQDLPVELLRPNPFQRRTNVAESEIAEMADSIQSNGFFSVLFVRPDPTEEGYFQIVFGERRLRGAVLAKLAAVPCRIQNYTDKQMEDIGLSENLQRKDLNPLDEAEAFQQKLQQVDPDTGKSYSMRGLARALGTNKDRIEERIRLMHIPEDVKSMLRMRSDTMRAAFEIAKVPLIQLRTPLITGVLDRSLDVQDVMFLVRQMLDSIPDDIVEFFRASPHVGKSMLILSKLPKERRQVFIDQLLREPNIEQEVLIQIEQELADMQSREGKNVQNGKEISSQDNLDTHTLQGEKRDGEGTLEIRTAEEQTKGAVTTVSNNEPKHISKPTPDFADFTMEEQLRNKQMVTDANTFQKIIKRWKKWAQTGEYEKDELFPYVVNWSQEIQELEDSVRPDNR